MGKTLTQADLLLDYLERSGVEYVFGIPGGAIEPLYNALARRRHNKRYPVAVVSRHEAGAAYMADGYARESGRIGACCSTTGPGAINLLTGIANAYTDNTPVIAITPQTALPKFGRKGLQESSCDAISIPGMFSHCTRYNSMVSHVEQLEGKIYSSLIRARQHPQGPVHLSIPMDILSAPLSDCAEHFSIDRATNTPRIVDTHSLEEHFDEILNAKSIVLLLGAGAYQAKEVILAFAETVNAKIITTPEGKRCAGINHPQYQGVFGFAGHKKAREALLDEHVDMVIAIGTRLSELETGGWDYEALLNSRLVHIDENADNFLQSPMARIHIYGDIETIFSSLVPQSQLRFSTKKEPAHSAKTETITPDKDHFVKSLVNDPDACFSDAVPIKPQRLMWELSHRFPTDTRFTIDTGNSWAWATHYLHLTKCDNYHVGMSFGSMGWGIGAAIGIAFANRDTPVVAITGDGSYLMSGQEITVALEHNLTVIIVILNDSALGMIKHGQRLGGAEEIGYQLPEVDYAMMARSMGIQGYNLRSPQDIAQLDFDTICNHKGPTLLNVYIDPEEVPPMGVRSKTLRNVSEQGSLSFKE